MAVLPKRTISKVVDVITALFVAWSAAIVWFTMWTLFDCLFPLDEHHIWIMLFVGFGGSYLCMFVETLSCFVKASRSKYSHVTAKLIHDFCVTWFQVLLWKGWWDLLDFYTSTTFPQVCELIVSTLILISCRSLTTTAQFTITKEEICKTPTYSDTLSTGFTNSANITSTLVLVHILSITVWTQVWNLTDKLLLPEDRLYYTSVSISMVVGMALMALLFAFDQIKSYIFCCEHFTTVFRQKFLFVVYYLMASFGLVASIQCWRGVWGLGEYFMEQLQKEHMLNNRVLEMIVLCSIAVVLYLAVFFMGYSQNIAGYTLDFDKSDFDLSSHFLLWTDPAASQTEEILLADDDWWSDENLTETELVRGGEVKFAGTKFPDIGSNASKSSKIGTKSKSKTPKIADAIRNADSKVRVTIPNLDPNDKEPLLSKAEDEGEISSLEEQHKLTD